MTCYGVWVSLSVNQLWAYCHEDHVSPSTSGEVLWVSLHSSGHQYCIVLWFPAWSFYPLWSLRLRSGGNTQCWEVRGAQLIYLLFIPVVTLDLGGSSVTWFMLNGMCVFWGKIPVQPSQPCTTENSLSCFRCISIARDEDSEERPLFSSLLGSHNQGTARRTSEVEAGSS